jgi:hypothetical protein
MKNSLLKHGVIIYFEFSRQRRSQFVFVCCAVFLVACETLQSVESRLALARVDQRQPHVFTGNLLEIYRPSSSFPKEVRADDIEDRPVKVTVEGGEVKRHRKPKLL